MITGHSVKQEGLADANGSARQL